MVDTTSSEVLLSFTPPLMLVVVSVLSVRVSLHSNFGMSSVACHRRPFLDRVRGMAPATGFALLGLRVPLSHVVRHLRWSHGYHHKLIRCLRSCEVLYGGESLLWLSHRTLGFVLRGRGCTSCCVLRMIVPYVVRHVLCRSRVRVPIRYS
ncbi:hypothetical protein BJV78DRAFT_1264754 [Lactifluus subvellereus]|nr:hypothetical protein BJV78DRAFT_1264754 [Lactifluus subvellereus]